MQNFLSKTILKQLTLFTVVISILLISISCGESIEKPNVSFDEVSQDEIEEAIQNKVSSDYEFIPPSTLQVAAIFKKAGLTYDQWMRICMHLP